MTLAGLITEYPYAQAVKNKKLEPDIEKIKIAVCRYYDINGDELNSIRRDFFSDPRNVVVYLIRGLRNNTLKQVGDQFGIEKYSTVSSIVERVKHEIKVDKGLKYRVQKLSEKINKSQRQT